MIAARERTTRKTRPRVKNKINCSLERKVNMRYFLMILLVLLLNSGMPAYADDVATAVVKEGVRAAFKEAERQMIYKYYGKHPEYYREYAYKKGTEPGKGNKHKQKGLPPGIAMKLERGGTLPPGIAKQVLPGDLESQLPPLRKGYERRVVGEDVLLVESATGKIADIITDAILGD